MEHNDCSRLDRAELKVLRNIWEEEREREGRSLGELTADSTLTELLGVGVDEEAAGVVDEVLQSEARAAGVGSSSVKETSGEGTLDASAGVAALGLGVEELGETTGGDRVLGGYECQHGTKTSGDHNDSPLTLKAMRGGPAAPLAAWCKCVALLAGERG